MINFNTFAHTKRACYAGYVTQAIVNNFTPLLFVTFNNSFNISLSKISLLVSFNFGIQLLVDLLSSLFIDRIGYRKSIVAAHGFTAMGLILLSILPFALNPFTGLIISSFFMAIGGGLIEVLISPIVEACPGDGKSSSMSLLHSFYCWGHVGVIVFSTVFFAIFGTGNWRILSLILALFPIITGILFTKVPINRTVDTKSSMSIISLLKNPYFIIFFIMMLCAGASEQGMSQWASAFAEVGLNISKTAGDLAGPCFFAVLMGISRVVYSKISEKVNLLSYIIYSAVLCVIGYLIASLSPYPVLSLAGCAICGFSVGVMWPGVFSECSRAFPKGGTAMFALLALAGDSGCSSGPAVVGIISDHFNGNIKYGIIFASIFPVLMIFSSILLKNKKKAD